jgi:hypothetical protein
MLQSPIAENMALSIAMMQSCIKINHDNLRITSSNHFRPQSPVLQREGNSATYTLATASATVGVDEAFIENAGPRRRLDQTTIVDGDQLIVEPDRREIPSPIRCVLLPDQPGRKHES